MIDWLGVLARLGLGYEAMQATNPALIHMSLIGYDASGPRAHCPATTSTTWRRSGAL